MILFRFSLLLTTAAFAGCASVSLPPQAANVQVVGMSSISVEVHRPRLMWKDGELKLEAYAFRQWTAETTANTHIDVVYLNAAGQALAEETTHFAPRSLPRTMRRPAPRGYLLKPTQLPIGTALIEVRAHDGPHS